MRVCGNCDGFIPLEVSNCPNCGSKANNLSSNGHSIQKIVSGIASLSVSMTLMACYGLPPRMNDEKDLLAVLALSNSSNHVQAIITAPSDRGTLTIELGQKKFILQASQKSKAFNLYSETYHYKITDSLNNVIFEDTQFNFAKNSKDGIIIKSDSNVDFSDTTICYNLNGISGNLETIKCSELDSN